MRQPSLSLLLLCAGLCAACAGPRIALAPELAEAQELPVSSERRDSGGLLDGRSAGVLRFGAYEAEWAREPAEEHPPQPGGDGSCWTRSTVRFLLRSPGLPPRSVRCEARMEGTYQVALTGMPLNIADDVAVHRVRCQLPEGTLSLSDEGAENGWLRGELQVPGVQLALEPTAPPGQGWLQPAGYTLREAGKAVAAVHGVYSTRPRAVWLSPALREPTQDAAALASAALLLAGGGSRRCGDFAH